MGRLLVVGCGYVGSELARRAVLQGHEVLGLRRSDAPLPPGVGRIQAGLAQPGALVLPEVDWLVVALGADGRSPEAYRAAYVDAPAALHAALPAPPRREVVLSSTGVFGRDDGGDVFADARPAPATATGAVLLEAEDAALRRGATVLRLAGIYGPGRVGLLRRVIDGSAWQGRSLGSWANLVHRDDAAGLALHLLGHASPPAVHGVDDDPVPRRVLLGELADLLGCPRPEGLTPTEPTRGKRVRNASLHAVGYRLLHPSWRGGYRAVLEQHPDLIGPQPRG